MGNRSDRRFANLANPLAPRGRSTDQDEARGFHHGPEQITELLTEAVYTNATGFTLIDRAACDQGWVHIRGFESTPLAIQSIVFCTFRQIARNPRVYGRF